MIGWGLKVRYDKWNLEQNLNSKGVIIAKWRPIVLIMNLQTYKNLKMTITFFKMADPCCTILIIFGLKDQRLASQKTDFKSVLVHCAYVCYGCQIVTSFQFLLETKLWKLKMTKEKFNQCNKIKMNFKVSGLGSGL